MQTSNTAKNLKGPIYIGQMDLRDCSPGNNGFTKHELQDDSPARINFTKETQGSHQFPNGVSNFENEANQPGLDKSITTNKSLKSSTNRRSNLQRSLDTGNYESIKRQLFNNFLEDGE